MLGLLSLIPWMTPGLRNWDALHWLTERSLLATGVLYAAHATAVLFVEPFFVASGFAMYLNRRVELEAWDVEQGSAPCVRSALTSSRALAARDAGAPPGVGAGHRRRTPRRRRAPRGPVAPRPTRAPRASRRRSRSCAPIRCCPASTRSTGCAGRTRRAGEEEGPGRLRRSSSGSPSWRASSTTPAASCCGASWPCWWRWLLVSARHVVQLRAFRRAKAASAVSHVRDLDVRPESLPDDVGAAAWALWQAGQVPAALSLLYRGALSRPDPSLPGADHRVRHRRRVPGPGARPARADALRYVTQVVRAWEANIYGGRTLSLAMGEALCTGFGQRLDASAAAAAESGHEEHRADPRLVGLLVLACSAGWIVHNTRWEEIEVDDAGARRRRHRRVLLAAPGARGRRRHAGSAHDARADAAGRRDAAARIEPVGHLPGARRAPQGLGRERRPPGRDGMEGRQRRPALGAAGVRRRTTTPPRRRTTPPPRTPTDETTTTTATRRRPRARSRPSNAQQRRLAKLLEPEAVGDCADFEETDATTEPAFEPGRVYRGLHVAAAASLNHVAPTWQLTGDAARWRCACPSAAAASPASPARDTTTAACCRATTR
jgi:hypothetical protein